MKRGIISILFAVVLVLTLGLVTAVPAAAASPTTIASSTMIFQSVTGYTLTDEGGGIYSGMIPMVQDEGMPPGDGVPGFDVFAREGATAWFGDDPGTGAVWTPVVIADHDAWPTWDVDTPDWYQYSLRFYEDEGVQKWLVANHSGTNADDDPWYDDADVDVQLVEQGVPMSGTMDWGANYASETDVGEYLDPIDPATHPEIPGGAAANGGGAACWDMDWSWGSEVVPLAFPGFDVQVTEAEAEGVYTVTLTPAAGDNPPGPVVNENTGESFGTIQSAIDAALPGDTINVAAGTYNENILIKKALTVKSTDGASQTIIDGTGHQIVCIQHSDVTFQGFTVTNPDNDAADTDPSGIQVATTSESGSISNVQILDNIVTQVRSETGAASMFAATGINVGYAVTKGNTLSDIVISGNTITDIQNPGLLGESSGSDHTCGINIWDGANDVLISNNLISDIKYNGIILEGASNVQIEGNTISLSQSGVRVEPREQDITDVQIEGNSITGCKYGISVVPEINSSSGLKINLNNFADNLIQVLDDFEVLDIGQVLETNTFDRAVVVDDTGASLLPTIWSSIQDGINAALAGDTVIVAAGTYEENVVVDKSLTLQGEDRETTIIQSQLEGGMYGTYGDRVVIIEADGVSISSFTLSGYTSTEEKSGTTAWPLYADDYGNLEASNNIFTFYTQGGIRFLDGDNLLIKDNIFQRETRSVWYDPAGVEPGSYVDRTYGGMGPELWGCTNATIDPNVIETYAVGIFIMGCDGVSIEDNIVSAPDTAMPSDSGIHIQTASNITVTGNTVSNFTAGPKEGYNNGTTGAGIRIISSNENVTIDGNQLSNNTVGVLVTGASGSPEIHRNNIEGNTEFGVLNCTSWIGEDQTYTPASVTIDAKYNWWGHPSGPSHKLSNGKWVGKGDKVSDNVNYKPWLHKSKEKTKKKPAYAQSVVLDNTGDYGWNTFSAPIFLDDEANTWKELYGLTELDYSVAYRFDSDNQTFVPLLITTDYAITPGEGFFIKMNDVGCLTILYSTEENLTPPSRLLTAGWNLIGLANLEDMNVGDAFPSIATAPGLAGYSQVVSPTGNAKPGAVPTDGTIYVGESYWVYMLSARTLAGFTLTPVDWVP